MVVGVDFGMFCTGMYSGLAINFTTDMKVQEWPTRKGPIGQNRNAYKIGQSLLVVHSPTKLELRSDMMPLDVQRPGAYFATETTIP